MHPMFDIILELFAAFPLTYIWSNAKENKKKHQRSLDIALILKFLISQYIAGSAAESLCSMSLKLHKKEEQERIKNITDLNNPSV